MLNVPAFAPSYPYIPTFFGRFLISELNSYFSPTFLQIPISPTFYLSYLMDTLAYWVVQQHKRFISTNTCSFNLHLAYRSPDHYYNFFSPMNSRKVRLSRCTVCQCPGVLYSK